MPLPERLIKRSLLAVAALCMLGSAYAATPVSASGAWIRLLPGDVPLAGYVTLHNTGENDVTLTKATSPAFKRVEFHKSMAREGMSRMQPVDSVTVPSGGIFAFKPGAFHIMMWRKHDLHIGEQVPVTLHLANGSRVTVQFTVKGARG